MEMHNPPHPGEVLREYMGPTNDVASVASRLGVTRQTLYRVLNGQNAVTAQMAISLEQEFKVSARMWLGLQSEYDLWNAREDRREAKEGPKDWVRISARSVQIVSKSRPGRKITLPYGEGMISADKGKAKLQEEKRLLKSESPA